jgi:Family of unknown function (DUF6088)
MLGLTTQVPTKRVYLTSGRSRRFKLGAEVVELVNAPQWMLLPAKPATGQAVRALEWIGERGARGSFEGSEAQVAPRDVARSYRRPPGASFLDVNVDQ